MKNASYGILTIAALLFFYSQFFMPNTNTSVEISKHSKLQNYQAAAYSNARPNQNDTVPGTYQTSNSISGFKDLILDSTYTYSYKVQGNSGEDVILEGSWELSYKDEEQHIILHRPLPNKASYHLDLANIEEHKLRVTPDGLKDLYTQENYLQLKTNEYSLAVLK